jgi:hypothetical protein
VVVERAVKMVSYLVAKKASKTVYLKVERSAALLVLMLVGCWASIRVARKVK